MYEDELNPTNANVKSVNKVIDVMEEVSNHPKGCQLATITRNTGINKSTAYRMLYTLEKRGYVEQLGNQAYTLTNKLLYVAKRAKLSDSLLDMARPYLYELQDNLYETINLWEMEGNYVTLLEKIDPEESMFRTKIAVGDQLAINSTAAGKVLLSHRSEIYWHKYWDTHSYKIEKYTDNTLVDKELFFNELDKTKGRHYGIDNEETSAGLSCVAVPIYNDKAQVRICLSATMLSSQLNAQGIGNVAELLNHCANQISAELGYKTTQ